MRHKTEPMRDHWIEFQVTKKEVRDQTSVWMFSLKRTNYNTKEKTVNVNL